MAPSEAVSVVNALDDGQAYVLAAVAGLADTQATARADPSSWTALECIEHIVLVEQRFLERLACAAKADSCQIDPAREAALTTRLANRHTRVKAPEAFQPGGKYANLAEAIADFTSVRGRTIVFARERAEDLYYLVVEHGRFGRLNGVELLLVIAAHANRHADQIREVDKSLRDSR